MSDIPDTIKQMCVEYNKMVEENKKISQWQIVVKWAEARRAAGVRFELHIHDRTSTGQWIALLRIDEGEVIREFADTELAARLALIKAWEKHGKTFEQ